MAVADAGPGNLVLLQDRGHQGTAHAPQGRGLGNGFLDGFIGLGDGLFKHGSGVCGWVIGQDMAVKRLGGHIAGQIAGIMAAHAVGHDDKGAGVAVRIGQMGDQEGVFLIVPGAVDLRAGKIKFKVHCAIVCLADSE